MLLCMTDLLGLLLSTILVLWIELIESALEHLVDILRYINVYVLLLLLSAHTLYAQRTIQNYNNISVFRTNSQFPYHVFGKHKRDHGMNFH